MKTERIGVMHLIDSLDAGGAERMAVNFTNRLPRERYRAHLCTTRREGALAPLVEAHVGRLCLHRRHTFDVRALRRLTGYVRRHRIQILHAHGTSLLTAVLASCVAPFPKVIWHDHFGRYATEERFVPLYRLLASRLDGVIVVNEPLADWARDKLRIAPQRVWYVPNFVDVPDEGSFPGALPGTSGKRIVCVANMRPEKDHLTLLRAFDRVARAVPEAHLLLVGACTDTAYVSRVHDKIQELQLSSHVSLLGQQPDVAAILHSCDIGVLSSATEGLPLALIEYGMIGLPVVATRIGQCAEVLDDGKVGRLVEVGDAAALADALVSLLQNAAERAALGERFKQRTHDLYSAGPVLSEIERIYQTVLRAR